MSESSTKKPVRKRGTFWASILLVFVGVTAAVILIIISAHRDLSSLETTLLQIIALGASLWGSYLIGQQFAKKSAREMVKPAARSAFRRVLGLYASLGRLAETINRFRSEDGGADSKLDVLQALVVEQQASATDAMEDWRDLVPEDVADVERRLQERAEKSGGSEL